MTLETASVVSTPLAHLVDLARDGPGPVRPRRTVGFSTRIVDIFLYTDADSSTPSSVRTSSAIRVEDPPLVSHLLAVDDVLVTVAHGLGLDRRHVEPRPGSDIENEPRTSPAAIAGRYLRFCSSVPCCMIM